MEVGRERNADPKWLLPEICRQGEVTKRDIGAIRIFDTETRFEVDPAVAEKFAANVAARKKGGIRIFPAPDGPPPDSGPARRAPEAPPRKAKPHRGKQKNKGKKKDRKKAG